VAREHSNDLVEAAWKGPRRFPVNVQLELSTGRRKGFWIKVPEHAASDVVRLWVLPGGRYAIPERMTFGLLDSRYPAVELDFVLEGGKLVCESIRRQPGKAPLTGKGLRLLKFDDLVEEALRVVAIAVTKERDGSWRGKWVKDQGISAVDTFLEEADRVQLRPNRGRQLTRKHYEEVAAAVLEARVKGRPVLLAIQQRFDASPTTAKRWKREADRLGLIPEPGVTRRRRKEQRR
jgi:hypothetical protein